MRRSTGKPSVLAIRLLALPTLLYRARLGRLLGSRFLLLTHRGRNSGRHFQTPLEVLFYDKKTREASVVSAFGGAADWYRNLEAGGVVKVAVAGAEYRPSVRFFDRGARAELLRAFRRAHPLEARAALYLLGWHLSTDAELQELAARLRAVAFKPSEVSA